MNILLTGASGWLGRHLAPRLQAVGHQVIGLDVAPGPYTTVLGSITDSQLIVHLFSTHSIALVVHCAALHKPDIVRYPAQSFVDVNVTGTLNLLEAAVAAGHDCFIYTSTTSLMISEEIRAGKEGGAQRAFWLDEEFMPLMPRNIYGVTKLSAEHLCRLYGSLYSLDVAILRTSRFFPEDDDMPQTLSAENLKANELLHRRLTVEDAADAHVAAIGAIRGQGCQTFVLSAPPPFQVQDAQRLIEDAPAVIADYFPQVERLYARQGWRLPQYIDRVYDPSKAQRLLNFSPKTTFTNVLRALETQELMPFTHDSSYISPKE